METFVFQLEPEAVHKLMDSNKMTGAWGNRATKTNEWIRLVNNALNGVERTPVYKRARIIVVYAFSSQDKMRDVNNYSPTSKAIVDGIVRYGILPDDNDRIVIGPDNRRALDRSLGTVPSGRMEKGQAACRRADCPGATQPKGCGHKHKHTAKGEAVRITVQIDELGSDDYKWWEDDQADTEPLFDLTSKGDRQDLSEFS